MDSSKRRIDKELGDFIYHCWKESGFKMEEFAKKLKIEPRTLNYYFSGQRKPIQRTLLRLIRISNVDLKNIPF